MSETLRYQQESVHALVSSAKNKPICRIEIRLWMEREQKFSPEFFAINFSNSPGSQHHTGFLEVSRSYLPLQNAFSDVRIKDTWVEADAADIQSALSCTSATHLQNIQVSHRPWQVRLNITYAINKSSKVRAEGAWRSTKYSSFPTGITKINTSWYTIAAVINTMLVFQQVYLFMKDFGLHLNFVDHSHSPQPLELLCIYRRCIKWNHHHQHRGDLKKCSFFTVLKPGYLWDRNNSMARFSVPGKGGYKDPKNY